MKTIEINVRSVVIVMLLLWTVAYTSSTYFLHTAFKSLIRLCKPGVVKLP